MRLTAATRWVPTSGLRPRRRRHGRSVSRPRYAARSRRRAEGPASLALRRSRALGPLRARGDRRWRRSIIRTSLRSTTWSTSATIEPSSWSWSWIDARGGDRQRPGSLASGDRLCHRHQRCAQRRACRRHRASRSEARQHRHHRQRIGQGRSTSALRKMARVDECRWRAHNEGGADWQNRAGRHHSATCRPNRPTAARWMRAAISSASVWCCTR